MAKARNDFTDILLKKRVLSPEQLDEAFEHASGTGIKIQDALTRLNYATTGDVIEAMGEFHKVQAIDLTQVEIPKSVIELVPEAVARDRLVIPLSLEGNTLKLIMTDPDNYEKIQAIQFILNRDIQPVIASQEQIQEAINRSYGQDETQSVDSVISEFTATQIDNTSLDTAGGGFDRGDDSDAPVVRLVNLTTRTRPLFVW